MYLSVCSSRKSSNYILEKYGVNMFLYYKYRTYKNKTDIIWFGNFDANTLPNLSFRNLNNPLKQICSFKIVKNIKII